MAVGVKRQKGAATVAVDGRASVRFVGEVRDALLALADEKRRVRIDLSGADSIDAAFVQLIASAHRTFAERGLELVVEGGDEALSRAFPGCRTCADIIG
jgi:anti-anti-sigma regulatory factor